MLARTLTSLVFFAILLVGLYAPLPGAHHLIFLIVAAATVWGTHEYYAIARQRGYHPSPWVGFVVALCFVFDSYFYKFHHFGHLLIVLFWVLLLTQVLFKRHPDSIVNTAVSLFGSIYVGLPMAMLLFIFHAGPEHYQFPVSWAGGNLLLFLVLCSWAMDIGGYLVGKPLGRHKMTPALSPNKSWEGMAGGIALSVVAGGLLWLFFPGMRAMFGLDEALLLPVAFAVFGTIGDLAESAFKRDAKVKESGQTYTGHGGMLDIIDSLLLTAPLFYLYLEITRQAPPIPFMP